MESPASLIQRQLDAYNRKDVEGWLSTYAEDARQYQLHGDCIASGHHQLRQRIEQRFAEPHLQARLLSRVVMQHIVVDHEVVTRDLPEGQAEVEMICIYEIANGLIQTASFALADSRPKG